MPNVTPPKYTKQVMVQLHPELSGETAAWAQHRGVSGSTVHRELIEAGLKVKRAEWEAEHGPLRPGVVGALVRKHAEQGQQQVTRRRNYEQGGDRDGNLQPAKTKRRRKAKAADPAAA